MIVCIRRGSLTFSAHRSVLKERERSGQRPRRWHGVPTCAHLRTTMLVMLLQTPNAHPRDCAEETDGDAEVSAVADGGKDDSQPSWMQDT